MELENALHGLGWKKDFLKLNQLSVKDDTSASFRRGGCLLHPNLFAQLEFLSAP
jgi:hypothetical protein